MCTKFPALGSDDLGWSQERGVILVNVRKWAVSVVLHLGVPGVSSGKRFLAEIGFKVRRSRKPFSTALGLGLSRVRPVVDGGGIVENRRSGDAQSRRRRSMEYGGTGPSLRQWGGRLVPPPMRAWLTPPHGRRHKAPPQPCALTTELFLGCGIVIAAISTIGYFILIKYSNLRLFR